MNSIKKIETNRLLLRPYEDKDLEPNIEILNNWEVTQWLSTNVPFPFTLDDGEKFLQDAKEQFADNSSIRYAMEDKESGRHMGGVRIFTVTEETEIGFWIHTDFWNKGFGTELLNAVINAAFKDGVIKRFIAQTASTNVGSRRILEKVGFHHQGEVPAEYARDGHGDGCSEFYLLDIADWSELTN